jgi:hypothetical protein
MKTKILERFIFGLGLTTTSATASLALSGASPPAPASTLLVSARAVLAAAAFGLPMRPYCAAAEPSKRGEGKGEDSIDDIVEMLAKRGKDAMVRPPPVCPH